MLRTRTVKSSRKHAEKRSIATETAQKLFGWRLCDAPPSTTACRPGARLGAPPLLSRGIPVCARERTRGGNALLRVNRRALRSKTKSQASSRV